MNLVKNLLVAIDTNVWISGYFWRGIPGQVIDFVDNGLIFPVFSSLTFNEFEVVLMRTAMLFDRHSQAMEYARLVQTYAVFFEPRKHVLLSRDSHDDMFLDIASSSEAQFLITGDEDLLTLKTIESTKIVTPKQFLKQPNLS